MPKIQSASESTRLRTPRTIAANAKVPPRTGSDPFKLNKDTQHRRLLTGVAYHSGIGEPDCCHTALAVLSASRALRRALHRDLGNKEMSEYGFIALVTLYAVEPVACTPDALAHDAEIDLEAMRTVLDFLEAQGWVCQEYQEGHVRPPRVHITDKGAEITILAVHRFLEISATLAGDLGADQRTAAIKACAQIVRAVAAAQDERSKAEIHL